MPKKSDDKPNKTEAPQSSAPSAPNGDDTPKLPAVRENEIAPTEAQAQAGMPAFRLREDGTYEQVTSGRRGLAQSKWNMNEGVLVRPGLHGQEIIQPPCQMKMDVAGMRHGFRYWAQAGTGLPMLDRVVPCGILPGEPERLAGYKSPEFGNYIRCELLNGEVFELCAQRPALRECLLDVLQPVRERLKIFQAAIPVFLYSGASWYISTITTDDGAKIPKKFYLPKFALMDWVNPKTGNAWREGSGPDAVAQQAALPKNEPAPIDVDDSIPFDVD
jgi:hypothetical protein